MQKHQKERHLKQKEQKARYIRIYTRGSILTSGTAHGGNHICEVEVYGKAIKNTTTQKKLPLL